MEQSNESITKRILHLNNLLLRSTTDSKIDSSTNFISREVLIDALILLYDECNNEFLMKDPLIADFVEKYRSTVLKLRDVNVNIGDFEVKKVISRGRFAEVSVAKEKSSQNICVLKKIRKSDILNVSERILFGNERNLLITASCNRETKKWVPQLYYTFQNLKYLYYVLEYCPGGNLCTMLEYYKKNVPEPMLRFYLAEMIQAIQSIHTIGFVHRDIRPDNILIDNVGHLKLIDFGSSAKLSRHGQVNSKLIFSTPHYTAPEIFKFHECPSTKGYTAQCDWWSLGIVLFELVCGNVPFTTEEVSKLYLSSCNYSRKLQYPKHVNISQELKNIISGLLQPAEKRSNYEKLMNLDYFNDIVWAFLKERDPPFVPSLISTDDTSYFTTFEVQRPTPKVEDYKLQRRFTGRNLPFLGFTYMGNDFDTEDSCSSASSCVITKFPANVSERRKTENYTEAKEINEFDNSEILRHSTGSFRDSRIQSECSDESYQSASVRLQNEVNQLHLFYNEKALIIEEKLKNKFHDMYNCITEDQAKLLLDKQLMTKEFKDKEAKLIKENEALKNINKNLENELNTLQTKYADLEIRHVELNQNLNETNDKLKKCEKLKKDSIAKLNLEIQKLTKDVQEKCASVKELEEKMLNLSNQQAAKLAVLSKTRTTLRSKSSERDKFEQDNISLKNQLAEANKKISKLTQDLEKKGKVKLDLELKMTASNEKNENIVASKINDFSDVKFDKNLKEVENLNEELKKKLEEISTLKETLRKEKDHKVVALGNLNQELDKKQTEISDLRVEFNKKQDQNRQEIGSLQKNLNQELQRKQKEIADLQCQLERNQTQKQKEITELSAKLNREQKQKQEADDKRKKVSEECDRAQKEIAKLQEEISKEQKQKNKEISDLLNKFTQEQKGKPKEISELRDNFVKELDRKQKDLADLQVQLSSEQKKSQKAVADLKEKSKEIEEKVKEIFELKAKLREESETRQKEVATLQAQISKMNEDSFANLVAIEDLKTAVEEKTKIVQKHEREIISLKEELKEKSKQVSSFRMSLCQSGKEKEKLESKIEALLNEIKNCNDIKLKELEKNRVDADEILKQFENTMRNVIKENFHEKDNIVTNSEFEKLFNTLQKRVSLACTPVAITQTESLDPEKTNIAVLEAQIERLESQLEKHRESAILQREAAALAKKAQADAEKELSNLKIDLRIAQREAKTAEEEIKKLQKTKYQYYKDLKEEKESLESKLKEEQQKIRDLELEIENCKNNLVMKENLIKERETDVNNLKSELNELMTDKDNLKRENSDVKKEKKILEGNLKEKETEIKRLKSKINKMKEEIEQNKSNFHNVKEEEENWKTKCTSLETTVASIKETCSILDKQVESFEIYIQQLEDKIKILEDEKSQLKQELQQSMEELKAAKKMANEEKSLKIFAENKIRSLESNLGKRDDDCEALQEDINSKSEYIVYLEDQMKQLEERILIAEESLHKASEHGVLMENEIISLKKERTELLTSIQRLTKEKNDLTKELDDATSDLNDLQKANGDLQSVLAQVEAYHEIRHLKDNETLQQHFKLIDFLQTKVQDATKQKRTLADKIFRNRGKENLNPRELENLLYSERNKSKGLAEQLYQAQIELMMLRGENISKCSSPKMISEYESTLSRSTTKNQLTSISNLSEMEIPSSRIKHNIPHKFETKRCRKPIFKCAVCSVTISNGNHSYCKECRIWCHVSCVAKIGPTCGLPQALVQQFSAMNKINPTCASSESSIKSEIEGNIKILRDGIWRNMNVCIESKFVTLYDKTTTSSEPTLKIPFSAIKSVDDNVDANSILTLSNSYDGEISCVLKVIYREGSDQKVLYLRACTEDEKTNWLNVLKRNITPKQITFKLEPEELFKGNVVCSFDNSSRLNVNQMIQLSPELCLLGTNEGLYSLKVNNTPDNKSHNPVKISGAEKVSRIKILTKLRVALLICGDENSLKKCDLRMLVSNAEAAACSSPYITLDDASNEFVLKNCSSLEASSCNTMISFITDKYFTILEWNDNGFDVLKYKKTLINLKCSLFTPTSVLYNTTSEFYRVDLATMTENKLKVFKCTNEMNSKLCEPEAIVKINSDLYLLCDKLFGIFIDPNGERIKFAETIKWPLVLKRIVYNKPFLCVVHENCVSLVYLPSTNESSEEKFKFSIIDFDNPTILGIVKQPTRGIYIKEEDKQNCKLFFLDPVLFMKRNPKQSWSSISTHSGETTDEECIQKSLNISSETDVSLNSSILESSNEVKM